MKFLKTILLIIIIPNFILAQNQEIKFEHYNITNGLSQSVVICVFQDSYGYIWFGTQNGLNKFNGYSFEKFIHNPIDTNSIASNWIIDIDEDKNGNIWIGTQDGLQKYDRKNNIFITYKHKGLLDTITNNNYIYGIKIADNGNILINTPPVLTVLNPNTSKFTRYVNSLIPDGSVNDYNIPIIEDSDGIIWIASTIGLSSFNPETKIFTNYLNDINNLNSISDNYVSALYEDSKKNIWIGTRNGLNIYNKSTKTFQQLYHNGNNKNSLSNNFIRTIIEDHNNNFWIGTDRGGLNKLTSKENNLFNFTILKYNNTNNNSISNDIVVCLCIDKSRNLWLGTLNGIDKTDLKKKKFQLYRKTSDPNSINLLDNVIASIYKDDSGIIWIGNWSKGLNLYNRKTNHVKHYSSEFKGNRKISNNYVHVIFKDNKNRIWIGTRNGIDIYDNKKNKFVPIQQFFNTKNFPDFKGNKVYGIIHDTFGNIWVGTQRGMYKLDLTLVETTSFHAESEDKNKISGNLIYSIIEDRNQNIWAATSTGLNQYNPDTKSVTQYLNVPNSTNTLCNNFTVSLCEDYKGDIWIGTTSGVNKFNIKDSVFTYYSQANGLPSNLVYEILEDNSKTLWFGTTNGLSKFDRNTQSFKTYTDDDGLQGLEFNLNASFSSDDGEVFFGGMNGFNSFYPDSVKENKFIPPVVFTSFEKVKEGKKQLVKIPQNNNIILTYKDDAFTIEFTVLEFTNPIKNHYMYKMEGLMTDWVNIENRNFVPFTNLPPAKYIFKVKGSNNDGVFSKEASSITIIVKPPWWKTGIAYIIYFILVIIIIILFIRVREYNLKRERKILEEKVKIRTAEIERQKAKIEKAHSEIQSSISYASKIQNAMLPSRKIFKEYFPDHFIFYMPRNIVSGDFYWATKINEHIIIAAVDCTGHGVPGAFLSMLGISLLNEIVRKKEITQPNQVLNELRERIKTSLKQTGNLYEQKDGMDMAMCVLNTNTYKMQYAGANNSLYLIRANSEDRILEEIKPDKMPIGIFHKESPFKNIEIQLQKNDIFYIFSDGYVDQFGGEKGKKFMTKNFKKLLIANSKLNMTEQYKSLHKSFYYWKGNHSQVDDVLVMGLKI